MLFLKRYSELKQNTKKQTESSNSKSLIIFAQNNTKPNTQNQTHKTKHIKAVIVAQHH